MYTRSLLTLLLAILTYGALAATPVPNPPSADPIPKCLPCPEPDPRNPSLR